MERRKAGVDLPADGEHQRLVVECSHQFHRAFHVFRENASSAWLELDLSITQLRNLIILSLRGPQHVGELATALGVSEPSASQVVDRLAQRAHLLDSVRTSRSDAAEGFLDQLDDDSLRALAKGTRALADAAGASDDPKQPCGMSVPAMPLRRPA
jgi:hypothetical protein